jgi:hypothetical protein
MAFIEDSVTAKKCRQTIKHKIFLRHWLLQTPEEKMFLPLAIGENYIKKIFLFFNILFMDVFTYR